MKSIKIMSLWCVFVLAATAGCPALQIANVDFIHKYILQKHGINMAVTNSSQQMWAANVKYMLCAVDVANTILNGHATTSYCTHSLATQVAIDRVAAINAIDTLIVPPSTLTPIWSPRYDICETNTATKPVEERSSYFLTDANAVWGACEPVIIDQWNIKGWSTSPDPENGAALQLDKGVNFGTSNEYWRNTPTANKIKGRMNQSALGVPLNQPYSFSVPIEIPATGYYYMGVGVDNYLQLYLNGTLILNRDMLAGIQTGPDKASNRNMCATRLYKIHLTKGVQMFGFEVTGGGVSDGVWFELYNATKQQIIDSGANFTTIANTDNYISPYRIWSTKDNIDNWSGNCTITIEGKPKNYTNCKRLTVAWCDSGWSAQNIGGNMVCVSSTRVNTGNQLASIILYTTNDGRPLDVNGNLTTSSGLLPASAINTSILSGTVGGNIVYNGVTYVIKSTFTSSTANFNGIPVKKSNAAACPS